MTTDDIRNWMHARLWYQVPISISVIDQDFKVVEANPHFAQNFGDWPAAANSPAAWPTLAPFRAKMATVPRHRREPAAKANRETWMLLTVTSVANWPAGSDE